MTLLAVYSFSSDNQSIQNHDLLYQEDPFSNIDKVLHGFAHLKTIKSFISIYLHSNGQKGTGTSHAFRVETTYRNKDIYKNKGIANKRDTWRWSFYLEKSN